MEHDDSLAGDLLHGAKAIADYLGIDTREVYWQVERGNIPVTRMGRLIISSKATLRSRFIPKAAAEGQAVAA
jgi:hypothetical protein